MGLGKTVQAIALMACYRDEWPCLLVVPSTLRTQWAAALHRWLCVAERDIRVVHKNAEHAKLDGLINIVSYNFMTKARWRKFTHTLAARTRAPSSCTPSETAH